MIAIAVRYVVRPGKMEAALEALRRMKVLMADEPGCVFYQVSRDRDRENALLLYEVYRDEAALEAHADTPHFKDVVLGEVIPMLESRNREYFTVEIA